MVYIRSGYKYGPNLAVCKRGGVKVGVAEVGVRVGVGTATGIVPKYILNVCMS